MYLCNHRSWADFFVDYWLAEARGQFLSRWAVALTFPHFVISCYVVGGVLLFKRNAVQDKDQFNAWLDASLDASPMNGIVAYPEGTRSRGDRPLPLRKGIVMYAFLRKIPVQCVVTAGKETGEPPGRGAGRARAGPAHPGGAPTPATPPPPPPPPAVLGDEKRMQAHFNRTLRVGYSRVLDPGAYGTGQAFFEDVERAFAEEWERAHATPVADCVAEDKLATAPFHGYTGRGKALQVGVVTSGVAMLGALGWAVWRGVAWAVRALAGVAVPGLWVLRPAVLAAGLGVWWAGCLAWGNLVPDRHMAAQRAGYAPVAGGLGESVELAAGGGPGARGGAAANGKKHA